MINHESDQSCLYKRAAFHAILAKEIKAANREAGAMKEFESTYIVQDRNSQAELNRLIVLDQAVTKSMGGVLPEQPDPTQFRRVLDIGCGPGGWILETARTYPQIQKLYGIDISTTIINHARTQAEQYNMKTGPRERVEFLVMDALRMLEFPHDFFDLVNLRFGISFMRQWEWPKLFDEMQRVTRTGGIVRIVESEAFCKSASVALSRVGALVQLALFRSGHLFKEEPAGLINQLPSLLIRHGFQNIQSRDALIEYRAGTETGDAFFENYRLGFQTIRPFLYRYGCMPDDYDAICKQAVEDMRQPGFVATLALRTLWATNPSRREVGSVYRDEPR
jgi:ubiquinone/menaquinone biosynthesis C-methylase UbiE